MPQPPLFIIPSSITETFYSGHHSEAAREAMRQATILFVENLKPARRFVKALLPNAVIDNYQWIAFDKHSERYSVEEVQQAFGLKQPMALLSDAGYPSIGDPGFALVQMAHQAQVDLHPLPGACSFLMALSASGLMGSNLLSMATCPMLNRSG